VQMAPARSCRKSSGRRPGPDRESGQHYLPLGVQVALIIAPQLACVQRFFCWGDEVVAPSRGLPLPQSVRESSLGARLPPWQTVEKVPRGVILSPIALLRVNCAKDLHWFVFKAKMQMLRCAQHDMQTSSAACRPATRVAPTNPA
jgi:hypothetical protein